VAAKHSAPFRSTTASSSPESKPRLTNNFVPTDPPAMRTANSCPLGSQRCDSHSTSTSRNLPPGSMLAARPIISLLDYAVRSKAYRALSSVSCADPYIQRTEWNVRDSDATILFSIEPTLTGGSLRTMEFARKHGKPHLHLCAGNDTSADNLRAFFEYHDVKVLNVAGPRASTEPKVGQFVKALLDEVLGVPD